MSAPMERKDAFVIKSTDLIWSPCVTCARKHDNRNQTAVTCDAFPNGIPNIILRAENDHREIVDGDSGLTYIKK